ncbi:MAG: hypothetical protein ACI8XO_000092 [Verrucomicrobiales bacterium]|jgi:hypothetical protein
MLETPAEDHQGGSPRAHHQPLYSEKVFSDRKIFFMDLKENDRGRFVKITEDVRGRRDTIMLPIEALDEFLEALNRVADFEEDLDAHPADLENESEEAEAEVKTEAEAPAPEAAAPAED